MVKHGEQFRAHFEQLMRSTKLNIADKVAAYDVPVEASNAFLERIRQGFIPVMYANHLSLADGLLCTKLAKEIKDQLPNFPGFKLLLAASIAGGGQGDEVKDSFAVARPWFEKHGVTPVEVTTRNDIRAGRSHGDNRITIEQILEDCSIDTPNSGYGYIIFPAGNRQAGRRDAQGKLIGLQFIDPGLLSHFVKLEKKHRSHPFAFLPIGISGSQMMMSPEQNSDEKTDPKVYLGLVGRPQVQVRVGMPFTTSDILPTLGSLVDDPAAVNDFLMMKVARLVPPELQGIYRERVEALRKIT